MFYPTKSPILVGGAFGQKGESLIMNNVIYEKSRKHVIKTQKAFIGYLATHFKINYSESARIMESLQTAGIVSKPINGYRKVLINAESTQNSLNREKS